MAIETIERDFHEKVSIEDSAGSRGHGTLPRVHPFLFEDDDHLRIVLSKEGARWVLSDEAHTYMHLTYDIDEKDLQGGTFCHEVSSPTH